MNYTSIDLELREGSFSIPSQLIQTMGKASKKKPFFVFLHGAGERGKDNRVQTTWVVPDLLNLLSRWQISAYLLVPQCPENKLWVDTDWTLDAHTRSKNPTLPLKAVMNGVDLCQKILPLDPSQKWLLGISMGGFGAWDWLSRNPTEFTTAVPICGGADLSTFNRELTTSIWTFHGAKDKVISVERSRSVVKHLQHLDRDINYHEFPDVEHNAWSPAFSHDPFLSWMKTKLR